MTYHVKITNEALSDMEEIYTYIAEQLLEPEIALDQYNRIADAALTLDENPERCRVMDIEPEHSRGMRKLLVDNYTIFFVILEDIVYITDVLYSASDIEHRLKERG